MADRDQLEGHKLASARDRTGPSPKPALVGIIGGADAVVGEGGVQQGLLEAQSHHHAAEGTTRSSAPTSSTTNDSLPLRRASIPSREGFVQPASYLRRSRALPRPMPPPKQPETAVDREQRQGLVSEILFRHILDRSLDFLVYVLLAATIRPYETS